MSPSAAGCSRTHSAVTLGDWSDPLDPDAEIQMVYRQLLLGRDQLRWVSLPSLLPSTPQWLAGPAAQHSPPRPFIHSFHPLQLSFPVHGVQVQGEDGEASSGRPQCRSVSWIFSYPGPWGHGHRPWMCSFSFLVGFSATQ